MPTPALTPDQFLAGFPPPIQTLAHRTRDLVSRVLPASTEQVRLGWQIIGFYLPSRSHTIYTGFIIPHPTYVTLGFVYGILLDDPAGRLLGAKEKLKQVRYLTLPNAQAVRDPALPPWLRQAAELALMPTALRGPMLRAARAIM